MRIEDFQEKVARALEVEAAEQHRLSQKRDEELRRVLERWVIYTSIQVDKALEKWASDGGRPQVLQIPVGVNERGSAAAQSEQKRLTELGFQARYISKFEPAEAGDRDSGEGQHPDQTAYYIRISYVPKPLS